MHESLEDRLRSYGQVLDQAGEQHDDPALVAVASRPRPRRRALVAMGTAAAVTVATLGVISFVGGDDSGTRLRMSSGGQVPLQRGADGSFPHLLVEGWQVIRADDQDRPEVRNPDGSHGYHSAETSFARGGAQVTLHMTEGDTTVRDYYVNDRAGRTPEGDQNKQEQRTVLGYPATVTYYRTSTPETSAIWFADNVVYELVRDVGDRNAFFAALDALRVVDPDTWEAALPGSSVAPRERAAEVDRMLAGVPQPPGFDPAPLRQGTVAVDRYQLGVQVAGPVTCAWVSRWSAARHAGDRAAEQQAADALRTAPDWPILKEMKAEGDWPEGIWQLARSIAAGDSKVHQYTVEQYAAMAADCR